MKKIVSIIIIVFVSLNLNAQEKTTEKDSVKKSSIDSSKVKTLDSTIKTLYAVISGEKGEARDWDLFRHLFHPEAKLIPTGKNKPIENFLPNCQFYKKDSVWVPHENR